MAGPGGSPAGGTLSLFPAPARQHTASSTTSSRREFSRGDGGSSHQHTPKVSELSHLALVKGQRDTIRTQLRATQAATQEAQQSVSSLRKLAFRLAVRISVKEAKVAQAARSLANSRRHDYVHSRKHEGRIAQLQATLTRHEQRNRELLHNLEQAAQLTIQSQQQHLSSHLRPHSYLPASGQRPISPPLTSPPSTPPPSPPTRTSSRTSQTHPRRPSDIVADLTEIRTANERLIKAKKESDHALLLCRSRIASLQEDFEQSQNHVRNLEKSNTSLEHMVHDYEAKVRALEEEKSRLELQLRTTQEKLVFSSKTEENLRAELEEHKARIAELESECERSHARITELEESWSHIEEDLSGCKLQLKSLERERLALQEELSSVRKKLAFSDRSHAELQQKLASKEADIARLRDELKHGQESADALQQTVAFFEDAARELTAKIQAASGAMTVLEKQLEVAESSKNSMYEDMKNLQESKKETEQKLQDQIQARTALQWDVNQLEQTKARLQQEIQRMRAKIESRNTEETQLKEQVQELLKSRRSLQNQLREALRQLDIEEQKNPEAIEELERLRKSKEELEANLARLKDTTGSLHSDLQLTRRKLESAEKSRMELKEQLELSQKANDGLRGDAKLSAAEEEVAKLRAFVLEAKRVEGKLEARIAVAEEELTAVKKANEELETFLAESRADVDEETNARLTAAEELREKYQKKLSMTEEEIRRLQEENSSLSSEIERKDHDIETLRSHESSLASELRSKDRWIGDLNQANEEFAQGMESIEVELRVLRETKVAFQTVVKELRERGAHLEVLKEWTGEDERTTQSDGKPLPNTPPKMKRTSTMISEEARPVSRASSHRSTEGDEELEQWAREVERVRMLRDETVVQLRGLRQSESMLRKNLKASEMELQRLGSRQPQFVAPQKKSGNVFRRVFQWSSKNQKTSGQVSWNKPRHQQQAAHGMQKAGLSVNRVPEERPSVDVRPSGPNGQRSGDVVFDIESRTWKVMNEESSNALTPVRTRNFASPNAAALTASPASTAQKSRSGTLTKGRRPDTRGSTDSGSAGSGHRVRGIVSDVENDKLSWGGRMKRRMGL
ncbi:Prefoldin [Macrophomina phaseolina MS6]|uniref:Prefoldin n=1 Tax=Macrophomina phaseolina (strain MS6) TaxID=1126212 RepID=K2SF71_MACPH|nr:Prefoldin [Macrophomina phaseolina MS6]